MRTLFLVVPLALLAACEVRDPAAQNSAAAASATESPGGVVREAAEAPPTPAPFQPVQTAVIQSQPGPSGSRVDLTRAAVTGDVLTVQVAISHPEGGTVGMDLGQVSVVDDATSKRYAVLKDAGGQWMASPLSGADRVSTYVDDDAPEIYWFKFPAPPAGSATISINLPGIGPFDGIPVTRG
jgi:hypothetical protein